MSWVLINRGDFFLLQRHHYIVFVYGVLSDCWHLWKSPQIKSPQGHGIKPASDRPNLGQQASPLSYFNPYGFQSIWQYFMYLVCRKRALILKREAEANINKCCWLLCKISTSRRFTWILTLITKLSLLLEATSTSLSLSLYVSLKSSSSLTTSLQICAFGCLLL